MTTMKFLEPRIDPIALSASEAQEMLARIVRHFAGRGAAQPSLRIVSGNRRSCANNLRVSIHQRGLDVPTLVHEAAHALDPRWSKPRPLIPERRKGRYAVSAQGMLVQVPVWRRKAIRWHDRGHVRRMARIWRWLVREGLEAALLAVAGKAATAERRQARAACPPPLPDRIARREAQVARLLRRLRGLETRLRTARRSLAALRRAQAKAMFHVQHSP